MGNKRFIRHTGLLFLLILLLSACENPASTPTAADMPTATCLSQTHPAEPVTSVKPTFTPTIPPTFFPTITFLPTAITPDFSGLMVYAVSHLQNGIQVTLSPFADDIQTSDMVFKVDGTQFTCSRFENHPGRLYCIGSISQSGTLATFKILQLTTNEMLWSTTFTIPEKIVATKPTSTIVPSGVCIPDGTEIIGPAYCIPDPRWNDCSISGCWYSDVYDSCGNYLRTGSWGCGGQG